MGTLDSVLFLESIVSAIVCPGATDGYLTGNQKDNGYRDGNRL